MNQKKAPPNKPKQDKDKDVAQDSNLDTPGHSATQGSEDHINTRDSVELQDSVDLASIEAILFMFGSPIKTTKICEILDAPKKGVLESCQALSESYSERSAGLRIVINDDTIQMVTEKSQHEIIEKFMKKELEGELTNPALEVLAIVAYRGPLSKPDIEAIRGVNCSFTLRNLLLRGLIERLPHPTDKRTKLYNITHDFLRSLGLESIDQLPHWESLIGDKRIDAILYGSADQERSSLG